MMKTSNFVRGVMHKTITPQNYQGHQIKSRSQTLSKETGINSDRQEPNVIWYPE